MYDATQLDDMTQSERLDVFEALAAEKYGSTRFDTAFCRDFGYARSTVYAWRKKGAVIPYAVIFCLERMLLADGGAEADRLRNAARVAEALTNASENMAKVAEEMASLARNLRR